MHVELIFRSWDKMRYEILNWGMFSRARARQNLYCSYREILVSAPGHPHCFTNLWFLTLGQFLSVLYFHQLVQKHLFWWHHSSGKVYSISTLSGSKSLCRWPTLVKETRKELYTDLRQLENMHANNLYNMFIDV